MSGAHKTYVADWRGINTRGEWRGQYSSGPRPVLRGDRHAVRGSRRAPSRTRDIPVGWPRTGAGGLLAAAAGLPWLIRRWKEAGLPTLPSGPPTSRPNPKVLKPSVNWTLPCISGSGPNQGADIHGPLHCEVSCEAWRTGC